MTGNGEPSCWRDAVSALRDRYSEALDDLVPVGSPVALLNYPNHSNVGDSAIWLGELAYLRRRRCEVIYASDLVSHDPGRLRRRLPNDGVILLHGGGNFGDLWPAHQVFRERVVREHLRSRIVVLPQTVNFTTAGALGSARSAFSGHDNLSLVTRDSRSFEFARSELPCDVRLAPDSAFWLDPTRPAREPLEKVAWLARTDHEARDQALPRWDTGGLLAVDWLKPAAMSSLDRGWALFRTLRVVSCVLGQLPVGARLVVPMQRALFAPVARWHVRRGSEILSAGEVVITDRLHGHILCILMGIPHILVDEAHFKIRSFWETWTSDLGGIVWSPSAAEAGALARRLANGLGGIQAPGTVTFRPPAGRRSW